MEDKNNSVRPFLSTTICEKTALLSQTIVLQEMPNEVKLIVSNTTGKTVEEKTLCCDPSSKKINNTVQYPRLEWKYTIRWCIY